MVTIRRFFFCSNNAVELYGLPSHRPVPAMQLHAVCGWCIMPSAFTGGERGEDSCRGLPLKGLYRRT